MKRWLVAGLLALPFLLPLLSLLLPGSAHAQQQQGPLTVRTDAQKKQDAAIDRAYQDAVKRSNSSGKTTATTTKQDPWQDVRAPAGNTKP